MKQNHKKAVMFLIVLLLVFFLVFLAGLFALKNDYELVRIGLPTSLTNWIIILLSFVSIVKVVFELIKLEKH